MSKLPSFLSAPQARVGAILAAVAVLGSAASARFSNAGDWLPRDLPTQVGVWTAIDSPVPQDVLGLLGNPRAEGRKYYNGFGEVVEASVITAGEFENFHEPTVCISANGFFKTAERVFKIDGPGSGEVRAMIFRRPMPSGPPARILMYYWQQNRNASTATEPVMGNYKDLAARLRTGWGAAVMGEQRVMVRVYAVLNPEDTTGEQAQRSVDDVARALYRALREDGAKRP